jgi:hypothetical protein
MTNHPASSPTTVTLNLFQGPFLGLTELGLKAQWMLKRVQHDERGIGEAEA